MDLSFFVTSIEKRAKNREEKCKRKHTPSFYVFLEVKKDISVTLETARAAVPCTIYSSVLNDNHKVMIMTDTSNHDDNSNNDHDDLTEDETPMKIMEKIMCI